MQNIKTVRLFIMSILFWGLALSVFSQTPDPKLTRYVKMEADGGSYAGDGLSWATAKNYVQDAINDLHTYMQETHQTQGGRVFIAAGTYSPTESTEESGDGVLFTAFKVYEGITLYGGFSSASPEDEPEERKLDGGKTIGEMGETDLAKLHFENVTELTGNHTKKDVNFVWSPSKHSYTTTFPGNSYHVVWFATNGFYDGTKRAKGLRYPAAVDGVTITGGNAANMESAARAHNSYGGGVYMVDGSELRNCIVTKNVAARKGGAVYMDGGGQIVNCYVHTNQCLGIGVVDGYGGGVCVDQKGSVYHSVIVNNVARIGGGLALDYDKSYPDVDKRNPYAPAALGCLVANNTASTEAGGVIMRYGGVLNHMTIARNSNVGVDMTINGIRYGRSAGLYMREGGTVYNTVCWGGTVENSDIQFAAHVPDLDSPVSVNYSAFSNHDIADWSGAKKMNVFNVEESNVASGTDGVTRNYVSFANPTATAGVQADGTGAPVDFLFASEYNFIPMGISSLREHGIQLSDVGDDADRTNLAHARLEKDFLGRAYQARTVVGALVATKENIVPSTAVAAVSGKTGSVYTLFVDPDRMLNGNETQVGDSWEQPLSTINDALTYFREHSELQGSKQILVKEGTLSVSGYYFNKGLRTATINMVDGVEVYGGYDSDLENIEVDGRNPKENVSIISANITDDAYSNNACHIVSFNNVSNAVLDGFRLYFGNTASSSYFVPMNKYGSGVICENGDGATPKNMSGNKVRNCVIAHCSSEQGAAIWTHAEAGTTVSLDVENTVIRNNEAKNGTVNGVVYVDAGAAINFNHCDIVMNVGYPVYNNGGTVTMSNSVVWANSNVPHSNVSSDALSGKVLGFVGTVTGNYNILDAAFNAGTGMTSGSNNSAVLTYAKGATYPAFINPSKNIGVSEQGDMTIYGGVSDYTPDNMSPLVNVADPAIIGYDLTATNQRFYGGLPDIGALENTEMPALGGVIYVRVGGTGEGYSWNDAMGSVYDAVEKAAAANSNPRLRPQVWVAAGTYSKDPTNGDPACYIMEDGVNVYGGFPADGNPGLDDRRPLVSTSIYVEGLSAAEISKYETILQPATPMPDENTTSSTGDWTTAQNVNRRVLAQRETYNPRVFGDDEGNNRFETQYYYVGGFEVETTWDGFTIQNGFLNKGHQRSDGGAGARLWENTVLKNCIVQNNFNYINDGGATDGRAGGVYSFGGTMINCYIQRNKLGLRSSDTTLRGACYGGGVYATYTTMYNCVIAENRLRCLYADGGGMKIESGDCYNLTVVNNSSTEGNRAAGGIHVWVGESMLAAGFSGITKFFNTISMGNTGYKGVGGGNKDIAYTACHVEVVGGFVPYTRSGGAVTVSDKSTWTPGDATVGLYIDNTTSVNVAGYSMDDVFVDPDNYNYRLNGEVGVNRGMNEFALNRLEIPAINGWIATGSISDTNIGTGGRYRYHLFTESGWDEGQDTDGDGYLEKNGVVWRKGPANFILKETAVDVDLFEYNDMDYNERVQDCTVDAGAFEYNGAYDITPTTTNVDGKVNAIFFVTEPGKGLASAADADNAACKEKLQKVLDAAGRYKASHTDEKVVVKLAKGTYEPSRSYITDPTNSEYDNPRTYSIIVPKGVTLQGGWDDRFAAGLVADTMFIEQNKTIQVPDRVEIKQREENYTYTADEIAALNDPTKWSGNENGATEKFNGLYYVRSTNSRQRETALSKTIKDDSFISGGQYTLTVSYAAYRSQNNKYENYASIKVGNNSSITFDAAKGGWSTPIESTFTGKLNNKSLTISLDRIIEEYGALAVRIKSLTVRKNVLVSDTIYKDSVITVRVPGEITYREVAQDVTTNKTTLSGKYVSDDQLVQVYHVVTFTEDLFDENGVVITADNDNTSEHPFNFDALKNLDDNDRAVLDALFIENGDASGEADAGVDEVSYKQYGGAAIVTEYAHVKNCVVQNNNALAGGGALYLMPRAVVSGSLLTKNTAKLGGAIFVGETDEAIPDLANMAKVFTSTIVKNTAKDAGGGIHFKNNVRVNSTVLWENDGNSQANVSGQFEASNMGSTFDVYPFSFSAVENIRMPGLNNVSVATENDMGVRFEDEEFYAISKYSILARSGMLYEDYASLVSSDDLADNDFKGLPRRFFVDGKSNEYIDIGARAVNSLVLNTPTSAADLITRIYVSHPEYVDMNIVKKVNAQAESDPTNKNLMMGGSLANPMQSLDDALHYIREARKTAINDVQNTKFEVFLTGGTYIPHRTITGELGWSRANTFLIPEGVTLIGGLTPPTEPEAKLYCQEKDDADGNLVIGDVTLYKANTDTILNRRVTYDQNSNYVIEPWEMQNQSILSGHAVNDEQSDDVYHVISCIAAPEYLGLLPDATAVGAGDGVTAKERGVPVVLDGLVVNDGKAFRYEAGSVGSSYTYYKGGAVCVDGNWCGVGAEGYKNPSINPTVGYRDIPLVIRRCIFQNNEAGVGGAVFSNGTVDIYSSSFIQNKSLSGTDDIDGDAVTDRIYLGNGGAAYSTYHLTAVNTLFSNNEADVSATAEYSGGGGAVFGGLYSSIRMLNCDVVRNKAKTYPAIYTLNPNDAESVQNNAIVNSVIWGNEATDGSDLIINHDNEADLAHATPAVWFSAYEEGCGPPPVTKAFTDDAADARRTVYDDAKTIKAMLGDYNYNILINSKNTELDGPNFTNPSLESGVDGYIVSADWMPYRLNNLTDNGWTYLNQSVTDDNGDGVYDVNFVDIDGKGGDGVYYKVSQENGRFMPIKEDAYMTYGDGLVMLRISKDPNPSHYQTYIDLGLYEYQHEPLKPVNYEDVDILWVSEQAKGEADGSSWENATDDLQRAIETLLASRNGCSKEIRILEGDYSPVYTISQNLGFNISTASMNNSVTHETGSAGVLKLTIKGGYSKDFPSTLVDEMRDVDDYVTCIRASERTGIPKSMLKTVFYIGDMGHWTGKSASVEEHENIVPLVLDGMTVVNTLSSSPDGGAAIYYEPQTYKAVGGVDNPNTPPTKEKKLTISNCTFMQNGDRSQAVMPSSVYIGTGGGDALIYNSLFHSNYGNPLDAADTKVVNCTFALNDGHLVMEDSGIDDNAYSSEIHNSVIWKNDLAVADENARVEFVLPNASTPFTYNSVYNLADSYITADNKNTALSGVNNDVMEGPNFIDVTSEPELRNFSISPSVKLLNTADKANFMRLVKGDASVEFNDTYLDVASNLRYVDNVLDRGAYEYQSELHRVLYVNPKRVADGTGYNWESPFSKTQIQNALDLAAVYVNSTKKQAYVYVAGGSVDRALTMRNGVSLYGSVTTLTTAAGNDDESVAGYEQTVIDERPGIAGSYTSRTVIDGLVMEGANPAGLKMIVDGFEITNGETVTAPLVNIDADQNTILRNGIVHGTMAGSVNVVNVNNGLLYNTLIHGNSVEAGGASLMLGSGGKAVNVTVAAKDAVKDATPMNWDAWTAAGKVVNSICYNEASDASVVDPFAPYFDETGLSYSALLYGFDNKNLRYQLMEKSVEIDGGDKTKGEVAGLIDYEADRDLLGNPRLMNADLDNGCFETWYVPASANMTIDVDGCSGNYYPHDGSVVYLNEDANLILDREKFAARGLTFSPAYLLLKQGASLYGNGTPVALRYIAVEKNIGEHGALMALPYAMHYNYAAKVNYADGTNNLALTDNVIYSYKYNGAERAGWDYHWSDVKSTSWNDVSFDSTPVEANVGVSFEVENAGVYRFTGFPEECTEGNLYEENGTAKNVVLTQYDNSNLSGSTPQFTIAENMGWNLFGMPYLVSDYKTKDNMTVAHILYDLDEDGKYATKQSWADGTSVSVGDGLFTQTAIIDSEETLSFAQPMYGVGGGAAKARASIMLAGDNGADELELNPNETADAAMDYVIGSDGIKWMALNKSLPQVYACNAHGTRMSLVGSAPVGTEISLGVFTGDESMLTFALPDNEAFDGVDGIWLKDRLTGVATNLLENEYTATFDKKGTCNDRFTVFFGKDAPGILGMGYKVYAYNGVLYVKGLAGDETIQVFDASGRMQKRANADGDNEYSAQIDKGIYVVKINGESFKVKS